MVQAAAALMTTEQPEGLVSMERLENREAATGGAPSNAGRPEILFVTSFLPYPIDHGGAMAREGFVRALASAGSVSVLVLTSIDYDEQVTRDAQQYYDQFCRSFRCHRFADLSPQSSITSKARDYLRGNPRNGFWSEAAEQVLADYIEASAISVVCFDTIFNAKYLARAKRMNCRTILANHNVESDLARQQWQSQCGFSRWKLWLNWLDLRRLEKLGVGLADVVTAITDADVAYYRELKSADRVLLLGYSYPTQPNELDRSREEQGALCFVGNLSWAPNVRAAEYLVTEIMPIVWSTMADVKCYIVGKNPSPQLTRLQGPNVVMTGEVSSVREYYERAQLVVVPLREGSGIKVKVIEAMALGKAIVSTTVGVAGLPIENGKQLAVAESPAQFAAEVVQLLSDPSARHRIAAAAREFAKEHFSPKETQRQAAGILRQISSINAEPTCVMPHLA